MCVASLATYVFHVSMEVTMSPVGRKWTKNSLIRGGVFVRSSATICRKNVVKMYYGGLVLIVSIVQLSTCFAKQSFDAEPQQREVNPGEEVVLPCRIYDKSRNSICSWQKNGFPISLQTGKYQWDGDRQRGDCSLRIYKADINFDNGRPL